MTSSFRCVARSIALASIVLPASLALSPPNRALAQERASFHATTLTGDLATGELALDGDVVVAYARYRLRAHHLVVRREGRATTFAGDARVALCPCPSPPLTFGATSGRIEATGDVFLRGPRVYLGGLPVLALPVLLVRAPDHVGLLPPTIALRGSDGLLIGSGVRLPWKASDGAIDALDLEAGGYVQGGVELGAKLATAGTETRLLADLVHGDRVETEARGALGFDAARSVAVSWSLDAIRGDRALSGTPSLEAAARPFDTGSAEVSNRAVVGGATSVVAGGVVARAFRGEGPIAAGPSAQVAFGGPFGRIGSWSVDASGNVLADGTETVALGRAAASAEVDTRPGPFELRASAGGRARFVDEGDPRSSTEDAASGRLELALPIARAFTTRGGEAIEHALAPSLSVRGALTSEQGSFFAPLGGAIPGASWTSAAGFSTTLARASGSAARLDVSAGATGDGSSAEALAHGRLGVDTHVVAAAIEAAAVGDPTNASSAIGGVSTRGRIRLGALDTAWARFSATGQTGAGAGRARAIAWGAWASLPGDDLAYFAEAGWTGAGEVSVPFVGGLRGLRLASRVDADLSAKSILAVQGSARYRHPCGCFGLGLVGGGRRGREGVDVALSIDLAPGR